MAELGFVARARGLCRRHPFWCGGFLLVVLACFIAPNVGAYLVATHALPRLEQKLGRSIHVEQIRVRWGHVELDGVEVDGQGQASPVRVARVRVGLRWAALLAGRAEASQLTFVRPELKIVRTALGDDNFRFLRERLRGGGGGLRGAGKGEGSPLGSLAHVEVERGTILFEDEELGTFEIQRVDAQLARRGQSYAELSDVKARLAAGPSAGAGRLKVSFALESGRLVGVPAVVVSRGSLTMWKGFTLTGIEGGISPETEDIERAAVSLRGGYGGVESVLWNASGWIRPATREAEVKLKADRFSLAQLRPILEGTPVIQPETAEINSEAELHIHPVPSERKPGMVETEPATDDAVDFRARLHLSGLTLFHPMLGSQPVRDLGLDASIQGQLRPLRRTLRIERAEVDYRGVQAILTAYAEKLGKKPAFDVRLQVLPVPCQTALRALPVELTPMLAGFQLQGVFHSEIHLAIDLSRLDQGVDLGGTVGIDGCRVSQAPNGLGAARLLGSFDHAVEIVPGEWLGFTIGPANPDWVPFEAISPHLVNSIMTTEDSTFLRHKGFIPSEFRSALKANLERGYFRLGASSITMQMVKNVLLTHEKTLARKLQELFLTWYVERNLSKERILEIYFNAIEFGPGIYGIGRAARHYFGKAAKDLEPREAAWFSSILPSPKRRYAHFCRGALDVKWETYLNRILRRMHERGRLTDEEYELAIAVPLVFSRSEASAERECFELIRRLTTRGGGAAAAPVEDESIEP